ncbi:hypothetical protein PRUPE_6G249700 [Prunus persica]|uniref:Uncharacterized protein n=1 Tax=Prunus persica TaxID=3760 RepID=A0A251NVI1_PRUPE|nr:hypothetical protein PRUPE_6G249700 [Prunus persica]
MDTDFDLINILVHLGYKKEHSTRGFWFKRECCSLRFVMLCGLHMHQRAQQHSKLCSFNWSILKVLIFHPLSLSLTHTHTHTSHKWEIYLSLYCFLCIKLLPKLNKETQPPPTELDLYSIW